MDVGILSVVCCQVEVSATGRSLFRRNPTDCGVSECVRGTCRATRRKTTLASAWRQRKSQPQQDRLQPGELPQHITLWLHSDVSLERPPFFRQHLLHTRANADTHTLTHTHTHSEHSHPHIHKHTHTTLTRTDAHTLATPTHTHTYTPTHTNSHTHIHTLTGTHIYTQYSRAHTQTHIHTQHSRTHTLTRTHIHTHPLTHTHTHAHKHTHTCTYGESFSDISQLGDLKILFTRVIPLLA